jgi:dihydroorotate dehydrogenase (fumarate)
MPTPAPRASERGTPLAPRMDMTMVEHDNAAAAVASPDLSTEYMGLRLKHPFMVGASPLAARLDNIKRLEEAGAAAIVLPSLFEEQITEAATGRIHGVDRLDDPALGRRVGAFPSLDEYALSPDAYLAHLRLATAASSIPIIASLNGTAAGAWLREARLLEEAGAAGLEVNFYNVASDFTQPADAVEGSILSAVSTLKRSLRIPIAVKLPPFFTTFAHFAARLSDAGANALVLFNRFYQPDIDITRMIAVPGVKLSTQAELLLRLRWLAILSNRVSASLALTGGVASWEDGAKAILAGAHAVQTTSLVLRDGPQAFGALVEGLRGWMIAQQISSVSSIRGRADLTTEADAIAFERASYIRTLHQWGKP